MFCKKCGTKVPDDAEFCPECGTRIGGAPIKVETLAKNCLWLEEGRIASGISAIIATYFCLISGLVFFAVGADAAVLRLGVLLMVSVIGLVAGILTLMEKFFPFAIIGSGIMMAAVILTFNVSHITYSEFPPIGLYYDCVFLLGSPIFTFSLLGLILTVLARKNFKK